MNRTLILVSLVSALLMNIPAHAAGDAKRGEELFRSLSCEMCHPGGGNALHPNKGLKGPEFAKAFPTDAQVAAVIRNGVPGTPMDSFRKDRISDAQLADIIAYIRSLTPPAKPAPCPPKGQKGSTHAGTATTKAPAAKSSKTATAKKTPATKPKPQIK